MIDLILRSIGRRVLKSAKFQAGVNVGIALGSRLTRDQIVENLNADAVLTSTLDATTLGLIVEIVEESDL